MGESWILARSQAGYRWGRLCIPGCTFGPIHQYHGEMFYMIRYLWWTTRGHRLAPWRSPYLLWRIETYCGVKMTQIGFLEFWEFMWRERRNLWHFLRWTAQMDRYAHPKSKPNH